MTTTPTPIPFTAPTGGVMTDEAGAITGDLELIDTTNGHARVRYAGAADVYTVTGTVPEQWSLEQVRDHLTTDPGNDPDGNPRATDLTDAY